MACHKAWAFHTHARHRPEPGPQSCVDWGTGALLGTHCGVNSEP